MQALPDLPPELAIDFRPSSSRGSAGPAGMDFQWFLLDGFSADPQSWRIIRELDNIYDIAYGRRKENSETISLL